MFNAAYASFAGGGRGWFSGRCLAFQSRKICDTPVRLKTKSHAGRTAMPQFVIEREMPGVGKLSQSDLKGASQGSCTVIRNLGPEIQWVHSYVTDDKIYCVYRAPSEDLIRKHAETAGFPANKIARVRATIDPTTAE
jgi:uncharacterized protein DUF4242